MDVAARPADRLAAIHDWIESTWTPDLTLEAWWGRLFDAGYAFPTWPEGLGGFGATAAQARAVTAALGAAGAVAPPSGNGPNMGGPTLLQHGTAEQHRRFVVPMGRGESQWCQLFSEPGAGSDLASLATTAELDGDELVITGQKVWNSKADVSDWGMLLCRTDPDVPKHRGISFVMLDMSQPGVEVRPLVQMNGGAEFCEVFLTEARARIADVVGGLNEGWNVARTTMRHERVAAAAGKSSGLVTVEAGRRSGNLGRTVGELIEASKRASADPSTGWEVLLGSRTMIGLARVHGVTKRSTLRERLVRYHIHSEVYRLNAQRTRDLARSPASCALDGSTAKLDLAMLAHESRDLSLAIVGPEGMLMGDSGSGEGRVQRVALSSFIPSIGGGTNEIQRNIIAERTLGLPREPGNDSEIPFRDLRRS